MNRLVNPLKTDRGITIIAVILALLFVGSMGLVVSNITQNKQIAGSRALDLNDAFYNAQGGIDWAVQFLVDSGGDPANLDGKTGSLGNGSFSIDYDTVNDVLTVTGTAGNQIRKVQFTCFGATFIGSDGGGGSCSSSTGLGLFSSYAAASNDEIEVKNQGIINGNISENIETDLDPVPDIVYPDFPTFPSGTYVDRTYSGSQTATISSGTYLFDDFEIKDNTVITINGPATFYMLGDLQIKNQARVTINGDVTFVAVQKIEIQDNSIVPISGDCKLYSTTDTIDIKNQAQFSVGGDTLILAYKDVELKDNVVMTLNGDAEIYSKTESIELKNQLNLTLKGETSIQSAGAIDLKDNIIVTTSGSDANLLVQSDTKVEIKNQATVNGGSGDSAADLLVLSKGDIELKDNIDVKGGFYAPNGKIEVKNQAEVTGSVVAGDEIEVKDNAIVNHDSSAGSNTSLCSGGGTGGDFPECTE
jgi:hypothetical protein